MKMKKKGGYVGGKRTMKPKGGMVGGRNVKATEMGAESNKQYVKRMFSNGMDTKITSDTPMENKGYFAGKKVDMGKRPMNSKGGMRGGKMTTKGGMRGGKMTMRAKGKARGGKVQLNTYADKKKRKPYTKNNKR